MSDHFAHHSADHPDHQPVHRSDHRWVVLHLQRSYPTGILEPTEHCWVRTSWVRMPWIISREGSDAESPRLYTGLVARDSSLRTLPDA